MRFLAAAFKRFFFILIFIYQWAISPVLHTLAGPTYGCRFEVSCSRYAQQCLSHFTLWIAVKEILKRLIKCHPF